jgi:hypothetical protein
MRVLKAATVRNFCDSSGRLYVYERGKSIRPSVPKNECVERDFYEYDLAGKKTDNDYEDWLSRTVFSISSTACCFDSEYIASNPNCWSSMTRVRLKPKSVLAERDTNSAFLLTRRFFRSAH